MLTLAADTPPGALFDAHCRACHQADHASRAPLESALRQMARSRILTALETGSMKAQAAALTATERASLAAYLGVAGDTHHAYGNRCAANMPPWPRTPPGWSGWGVDAANTRHQPHGGIPAARVPALKLKWAFGLPGANVAYGQPTVVDGRVFIGSDKGVVAALDARTGCVYWTLQVGATVRTAIVFDSGMLYFGDVKAQAYAADARTGRLLWKAPADPHPYARITGTPKLHAGRLYVPVSSVEEVAPANPAYACCTFRGSLAAFDAATGRLLWQTYTIPTPPAPTRLNAAGTQLHGPSGAAVWVSPTIDEKRGLIYIATGNGYSDPASEFTDAVIALDLATGQRRWARQLTPKDGWNFACSNPNKANCPVDAGEDVDIGASPVLGRLLYVGQKSGVVHALDPDRAGAIVWQTRVGHGGALGGIQWGLALAGGTLYVPLSDFGVNRRKPDVKPGGLFALDAATGERKWVALPPKPVAFMAAATVAQGVVYQGDMEGTLRAYDAHAGRTLWEFHTRVDHATVNGVAARGGSISGGGAVVAGGMLFVMSGYGSLGGLPGNVLLAFTP